MPELQLERLCSVSANDVPLVAAAVEVGGGEDAQQGVMQGAERGDGVARGALAALVACTRQRCSQTCGHR